MSGILKKTKCYLVGGIEFCNGRSWREYVTTKLLKVNIVVYNPFNKPFVKDMNETESEQCELKELRENGLYDSLSEKMKEIRSYDLALVDKSDFIFFYLDLNAHLCGSYEEIFHANSIKRPIFLVCKQGKTRVPTWLFGTLPHKYIYNSLDEAIKMVEDIDSGTKPIDSDRWRLLRTEFR